MSYCSQSLSILILLLFASGSGAELRGIPRFSESGLSGWKHVRFEGTTRYKIVMENGQKVLESHCNHSASALTRSLHWPVDEFPILNWSWKVGSVHEIANEHVRAGDDFVARVYVVHNQGLRDARALNYVWANSPGKTESWPNPFSDGSMVIPVHSGNTDVGRWQQQSRNVVADFKRYFDLDVTTVHLVAVMSDGDNSHSECEAMFGDLYFSRTLGTLDPLAPDHHK